MPNRLAGETSPYLLQHADNPVAWRPWGPEALAAAASSNRPILLSVGYAACHWCHVMAHESFEDPATAEVMNRLFVNIKVDREERPDLDTIYQTALAIMGQQGGWPLTMFLTPKGEPFWGGTYFPPEPRYGRRPFRDVLQAVADAYAKQPDEIRQNVATLQERLVRLAENQPSGVVGRTALDQIAEAMLPAVDKSWGGIGQAPKFPNTPYFELLWQAWKRTAKAEYRDAVTLTLAAMAQGGIYDHLGGGFARYATDTEWLVPHFEKMLYDNAQLVSLMTLVWPETRDPLLEARVAETIGWVLREMAVEGGGFASSLDADSEHVEGKFYVWSQAEIAEVLGPEAEFFGRAYEVTAGGNWEGHVILNRRRQRQLGSGEDEARLARAREKLLERRATRIRPGRDDKVLADWNGLMIAALAEAGLVFGRGDWIDAAVQAFAFVRDRMKDGEDRLHQSWRAGRAAHRGTSDAHAAMALAALKLYEATGERALIAQAESWVAALDRHFWDAERGGYFLTADDAEALIVRTKTAFDQATPAGNGLMVGVLGRLHALTGEDRYGERAAALIRAFSGELARAVSPLATWANGAELARNPLQAVLVAPSDDPAAAALARAVLDRSLPDRILVRVDPAEPLPAGHPAAGKGMIEGRATAYVCRGPVCQLPVTEPAALGELLDTTWKD